jgi:hypothetical protein
MRFIWLLGAVACTAGAPERVPVVAPLDLVQSDATWQLVVAEQLIVGDVDAVFWSDRAVLTHTPSGFYVIETHPEMRAALTGPQNAERWVHGPLSATGMQALATQFGFSGRPELRPLATALPCLRAGTAATAATDCAP